MPATAPYGAIEALRLAGLAVNIQSGTSTVATPSLADIAVHKNVYLGDADGNGVYTGTDAGLISRVAAGIDTGFDAHSWTDPLIVADADGSQHPHRRRRRPGGTEIGLVAHAANPQPARHPTGPQRRRQPGLGRPPADGFDHGRFQPQPAGGSGGGSASGHCNDNHRREHLHGASPVDRLRGCQSIATGRR